MLWSNTGDHTFSYSTNFRTKFSLTGDIITTTTGVILTKLYWSSDKGNRVRLVPNRPVPLTTVSCFPIRLQRFGDNHALHRLPSHVLRIARTDTLHYSDHSHTADIRLRVPSNPKPHLVLLNPLHSDLSP